MLVCKDFVVRCNVGGLSLQRFHFFNGIFLGRCYPEGFHAKSMVLKRFAPYKLTVLAVLLGLNAKRLAAELMHERFDDKNVQYRATQTLPKLAVGFLCIALARDGICYSPPTYSIPDKPNHRIHKVPGGKPLSPSQAKAKPYRINPIHPATSILVQ